MSKQDRPNILCLVSEDYPPRLGAYGDPVALTPHLDQLASEGVLFVTANCTSPVCAPSRFAILTGRHAESCPRAQHMQTTARLPESFDTYPDLLRKAAITAATMPRPTTTVMSILPRSGMKAAAERGMAHSRAISSCSAQQAG